MKEWIKKNKKVLLSSTVVATIIAGCFNVFVVLLKQPSVPFDIIAMNQDIHPDSPNHKYLLAQQYETQGKRKKALQLYEESAEEYLRTNGPASIDRANALFQASICCPIMFHTKKVLELSTASLTIYLESPEGNESFIMGNYVIIGGTHCVRWNTKQGFKWLIKAYQVAIETSGADDEMTEDIYDVIKGFYYSSFQIFSFVSFDKWLAAQLAS